MAGNSRTRTSNYCCCSDVAGDAADQSGNVAEAYRALLSWATGSENANTYGRLGV